MAALAMLWLTGCLTPLPDTGDDGTDNAAHIDSWTASCPTSDRFHGVAALTGLSNGVGVLDIWDTGSINGWNEEHSLAVTDSTTSATATGGSGSTGVIVHETMEITLDHVLTQGEVGDDGSGTGTTFFGCGAGDPFELGTLTFALRVYATGDRLSDCVAFGQAPEQVVGGAYPTGGGLPSNESEIQTCRTESF